MEQHIAFLVLGVLTLQQGMALEIPARGPRIAIVGGGIGGASASHFLTELLNGTLNIDLYEARTIGGRLATIKIDGDEFEAGGSIIHPQNMYMQRFIKLLGLEKNLSVDEDGDDVIWNGDEFISLGGDWLSLIKLIWRYGFQLFNLKNHIDGMLEDFAKIYDLQDAGHSFANATTLLSAMNKNFPELLRTSMKEYLLQQGFTEIVIDELVQATTVVNYGQEVKNIQSFVGCISMAASGNLWSVKGGNKEVPEHLIYRNKNVNVIPGRVTKIRNVANAPNGSQYEMTYINKGSTESMTSNYDIVIIAAPLTSDQTFKIEFVEFPNDLVFPGEYQTTHATFVKANLNLQYFGLQNTTNSILSCNPNKTTINAIGKQSTVDGSVRKAPPIWKIFSRESMESSLIHDMFSNVAEKKEIVWKAYPHYSWENLKPNNFKLHDAMYHVNAMEWAGSAMEMSAVAGRNVAILAYKDLEEPYKTSQHSNVKKLRMTGEF